MMKTVLPLLLSLLHLASALPSHRRIPDILERIKREQQQEQQDAELTLDVDGGAPSKDAYVAISHFDQRLDHSSKDEKSEEGQGETTFKQRYFYTDRYVRDDNGGKGIVAFLCVGGEGPPLDASVLVNSVHCTGDMIGLAEKLFREHGYDVHLFALGKVYV